METHPILIGKTQSLSSMKRGLLPQVRLVLFVRELSMKFSNIF